MIPNAAADEDKSTANPNKPAAPPGGPAAADPPGHPIGVEPPSGPARAGVKRGGMDKWSIFLSLTCAAHCLALPFAALVLPALAHQVAEHTGWLHWVLLIVAVPLSAAALGLGYRRHGFLPCLLVGALGLGAMFVGTSHWAGVEAEQPLSLFGAVCLIYAHLENLRRDRALRAAGS